MEILQLPWRNSKHSPSAVMEMKCHAVIMKHLGIKLQFWIFPREADLTMTSCLLCIQALALKLKAVTAHPSPALGGQGHVYETGKVAFSLDSCITHQSVWHACLVSNAENKEKACKQDMKTTIIVLENMLCMMGT